MDMNIEMKECPFCAEIIKIKAKKCRYCGEFLDGYTRASVWNEVGGAYIEGDVDVGNDFIGRDKVSISGVNFGDNLRDKQYELILNWDRRMRMREFDLAGRDLSRLHLAGIDLCKSNLSKASLNDAELDFANLSGADLSEADLSGASLSGANLSKANLSDTNLKLTRYNENTIWPEGYDYAHSGAVGPGSYTRGVYLSGASLGLCSLIDSDLSGADLSGASLRYTNLSGADLSGADLSRADLMGATLEDTNLTGANLENANLKDARLAGADLRKANLRGARYNHKTFWPSSYNYIRSGAIEDYDIRIER